MIAKLRNSFIAMSAILFATCFMFSGCEIQNDYESEANDAGYYDESGLMKTKLYNGAGSGFRYRYGLTNALTMTSKALTQEYDDWKAKYVTSEGASGYKRVKRDASSFYDTVSEGIAYGMLIALYFDDIDTFDDLYRYARLHKVTDSKGKDKYLMHWKVAADGTDVSEFRLQVTKNSTDHGVVYLVKEYPVYSEDLGKKVQNWQVPRDEERIYVKTKGELGSKYTYLPASKNPRTLSSATDADVDMAAALVMASYKVSSSDALLYRDEAAKMINAIIEYDISRVSNYYVLKNGTAWGGLHCWNPSYFSPAWFKLYIKFIEDNKHIESVKTILTNPKGTVKDPDTAISILQQTLDNGYKELMKAGNSTGNRATLYPDWCTTKDSSYMDRPTESDRIYYLDENQDGVIDNINGDEEIMSFNFYYDAVRVPWRLAVDYSWYGDSRAYGSLKVMRNFFNKEGANLVDGYDMHGNSWVREYRDGFNNFIPGKNPGMDGGQWKDSTSFLSMCGTAFMINDQAKAYAWAKRVLATPDTNERFNYYGNTLRLLSLLYLSGNFTNVTSKVAMKNEYYAKYVCGDMSVNQTAPLYANKSSQTADTVFDLVQGLAGTVKLRSYSNKLYVGSAEHIDDGTGRHVQLSFDSDIGSEADSFNMTTDTSGKTVFKWKSLYITADHGAQLRPKGTSVTSRERYELILK